MRPHVAENCKNICKDERTTPSTTSESTIQPTNGSPTSAEPTVGSPSTAGSTSKSHAGECIFFICKYDFHIEMTDLTWPNVL